MSKKGIIKWTIIMMLPVIASLMFMNNHKEEKLTKNEATSYLSIYLEDEQINYIPDRESGYTLDLTKSSCNNGVTISWDNKNWNATLDFTNYQSGNINRTKCALYFKKTIESEIIASLDVTGACPSVNEGGTLNIDTIENKNSLLCSAPDDYGTSYYYRGNVTNNYVKFAGFYWRIVRINGDGSIRMIYAGDANVIDALPNKEEVLQNGYNDSSTSYTQIGECAFNSIDNESDNAYVGYMFGTPNSATYEETHANINNSTIKTKIDNWYEENFLGTKYEEQIADVGFCNDRSISDEKVSGYSNLAYKKESTLYNWYKVIVQTLTCKQDNDMFTTKNALNGNKALTYPVGTLNIGEVILAGGYSTSNSDYYLYTGYSYWTMSPRSYAKGEAAVRYVNMTGGINMENYVDIAGVRPVINLKPGSLTQGQGTKSSPYTVE